MKMSTLRDRSKPVMFGLALVFLLFMTGTFQMCTGQSTGANRAIGCNPDIYMACSDESNFNVTVQEYYRRYQNSQDFFHLRANPFGSNSQYSATDMQLDTINALNQVWTVIINERIVNKFISDLGLNPPEGIKELKYENWDGLRTVIKNYPQLNSTFKKELEDYGLYVVDSTFNQTLYEAAVSTGKLPVHINEGIKTYNPQVYIQNYALRDQITGKIKTDVNGTAIMNPNRSRFGDWFSTIKRYLANTKLNYIINSTQSLSELELKDQLLLEQGIFDFDYLTLSMKDIETEVTNEEIEIYYNKIKNDPIYNLKAKPRKIIEFVKWDMKDLDEDQKDEIKILANEFKRNANQNTWEKALISNNTYSLHSEVILSNEFSLSGSGLSTQIINSDSSRTPLYNIIGAGRNVLKFAFENKKGTIKRLPINSDRNNNGFNDIGVFYIKDEINEDYLSLEESGISDKLRNELIYQKKYAITKEKLEEILSEFKIDDFNNETEVDLLAYLADNNDNLLLMNHNGTINDFVNSLINTDLRNTLIDVSDLKAFLISLDKGFNDDINPIDNENIVVFRMNTKSSIDPLLIKDYKDNQLIRLNNTQSNLFVEDQKESAKITDNRKIVIYGNPF